MLKLDISNLNQENILYKLEKEISKCDIVSLDIFDTTIIRLEKKPTDIFSLMNSIANKLGVEDFKKIRLDAQRLAFEEKGLNVDFDDIYKCLSKITGIDEKTAHILKAKEFELEIEYSFANETVKDIIKFSKSIGKKVIFISDMYLSAAYLKKLLDSKGIVGYDKIYSSCDVGNTKRNGLLFKEVYKLVAARKDINILHIGDSLRSDFINAWKTKNFKSIYLPRVGTTVEDKIKYYSCSIFKPIEYRWGYQIMAPVIYSFCQWLDEKINKSHMRKVLFLTREGAFFKKYFDSYMKGRVDTSVFYASRRSLIGASADINKNVLWNYLKNYNFLFIADIFSISIEKLKHILKKYDCEINMPIDSVDRTVLMQIMDELHEDISRYSIKQREYLLQYLSDIGISDKNAIVDIGWKGSSQNYLEKIINYCNKNNEFIGLYWGEFYDENNHCNKNGFLCSTENESNKLDVLNAGFIFENILSMQVGSTLAYYSNKNVVMPILDKTSNFYNKHIYNAQVGIAEGFDNIVNIMKIKECFDDKKTNIKNMFDTLNKPNMSLAKVFGDIEYKDGNCIRYVSRPQKLYRYILSPKSLLEDIHYCGWNSAFCQRLFRIPLPWFSLYKMMKNFR